MSTTRYVWEIWDYSTAQKYHAVETETSGTIGNYSSSTGTVCYTGYSVDETTGEFSFSGTTTSSTSTNRYYLVDGVVYYGKMKSAGTRKYTISYTKTITSELYTAYIKGSILEGLVSSASSGAFPNDGYASNYYYVLRGSDSIDPVAVIYTDDVIFGENVTLNIASNDNLGGTISYKVQTTTDGTSWTDAGSTNNSTYVLTIPYNANNWNVRVLASDDLGFTSETYVYGNDVSDTVSVMTEGLVPHSGYIGYITSNDEIVIKYKNRNQALSNCTISSVLNGAEVYSVSANTNTDIAININENVWKSLNENKEITLDVTAICGESSTSKTYTFKKFIYDNTSTSGVWSGMAKAVRIKQRSDAQIIGRDMPKEILKVENFKPASATSSKVFYGYTFYNDDSGVKMGSALATPTNVTAAKIPVGITCYDNDGNLITGDGSALIQTRTGTFNKTTSSSETFTVPLSFTPVVLYVKWSAQAGYSEYTTFNLYPGYSYSSTYLYISYNNNVVTFNHSNADPYTGSLSYTIKGA